MRKARQVVFTPTKKVGELQGWERATAEAERQIAEHEQRIARLRLSIETFREMRERGEPFIPDLKTASDIAA